MRSGIQWLTAIIVNGLPAAAREVSIGAIYATLARLEGKGYVKSQFGEPTPERGGRSKRFFHVTAKGMSAVNRTHRAVESMISGLELIGSHS